MIRFFAICLTLAIALPVAAQSVEFQPKVILPHGTQLDEHGRLNFGIGKDRSGWVELRLQPKHESLLAEIDGLVSDVRLRLKKADAFEDRLADSFWRGGFFWGISCVCAFEGAIALGVIFYRSGRRE